MRSPPVRVPRLFQPINGAINCARAKWRRRLATRLVFELVLCVADGKKEARSSQPVCAVPFYTSGAALSSFVPLISCQFVCDSRAALRDVRSRLAPNGCARGEKNSEAQNEASVLSDRAESD